MDTQQEYIKDVTASMACIENKIREFKGYNTASSIMFNVFAPILALINFIEFNWVFFIIQVAFLGFMALTAHCSKKRMNEQIELWELESMFKSMALIEMFSNKVFLPDLDDQTGSPFGER